MEKAIKMLKESTSMLDKMKKHILYDQPDFGFLETVENIWCNDETVIDSEAFTGCETDGVIFISTGRVFEVGDMKISPLLLEAITRAKQFLAIVTVLRRGSERNYEDFTAQLRLVIPSLNLKIYLFFIYSREAEQANYIVKYDF